MRSPALLSSFVVATLSLTAGAARAQEHEPEYPVSFVERPLTLPRFALAPSLELDVSGVPVTLTSSTQVLAGMQIGATFGITHNLEVGAIVVPVQFNDTPGYGGRFVGEEGFTGNPMVYGTFRFLHTPLLDLGARLRIQIAPGRDGLGTGALIEPSVPLLLHIGKIARLDAEVGIPITVTGATTTTADGNTVTTSTTAAIGLDVPVRLAFDIIEPLHVGASSGLRIDDFGNGGATTFIPLGVFGGYAIGARRPLVDVDAFFSFYDFLSPGGGPFSDTVNPSVFVVGVSARGYLYL